MAEAPQFISTDVNAIIEELVAYYESATGRTLQPAQVERLIINAFAYREALIRSSIQDTAEQMLVDFSRAPALDYLGALVGVSRLASTPAKTTLEFTLVSGHTGVTVPVGTRVTTTDGKVIFETTEALNVVAGVTAASVEAQCQTAGIIGNGYALDTVVTLLDPQAFIVEVTNTDETAGGSDQESDDELRERIKLAPGSFSNAGSRGAYKYWAKSAHPSIIDVAVTSPVPGDVLILPLMEDGSITPTTILDAVYDACNDEKIRPLTDLVTVQSPTRIDYTLAIKLTLYNTADGATVTNLVTEALDAFLLAKRQTLGQDVVGTQIIAVCQQEGVYEVDITPFTDITVAETEFAYCTSYTITITSYVNG
jgi:phage-related baseplate assembly protein